MQNQFDIGDRIRLSVSFKPIDNSDIEPTGVVFKLKNPSGQNIQKTYGVDPELIKESKNNYYVDIDLDKAGTWYFRFAASGPLKAASEGSLSVRASYFE